MTFRTPEHCQRYEYVSYELNAPIKDFFEDFLKPRKWSYLKENVEVSTSRQPKTGTFKISAGISKPRHVLAWVLMEAKIDSQRTKYASV